MNIEERRKGRVVASHRIAVTAFRLGGVFAVAAVVWAGWVVIDGGSWWGPVHAFLLGAIALAISGAAQMFTITWSAAPAPPAVIAAVQRWSIAGGAGAVLLGVTRQMTWLIVVGAVAVVAGVVLLGTSLVSAVRHSLLRRFDLSARFYLLAIGCAVVGMALGAVLGAGWAGSAYVRIREVHGHLNLVGFVGFTIVGTLPTILPTFAHHRAVSGREAIWGWRMAVLSAVAMVSGLVLGVEWVAVGTLLAALALAVVLSGVVIRLAETGAKGGLPYMQVLAGSLWLVAWAVVDAVRLFTAAPAGAFDRWIAAAIIAGVGQVLFGSLAYLIPVLAGSGPRLTRNFGRFDRRRWIPLGLANLVPLALVVGFPAVAAAATAGWVVDFGVRLAGLERGGSRPR